MSPPVEFHTPNSGSVDGNQPRIVPWFGVPSMIRSSTWFFHFVDTSGVPLPYQPVASLQFSTSAPPFSTRKREVSPPIECETMSIFCEVE
jgi:hypothetical protein